MAEPRRKPAAKKQAAKKAAAKKRAAKKKAPARKSNAARRRSSAAKPSSSAETAVQPRARATASDAEKLPDRGGGFGKWLVAGLAVLAAIAVALVLVLGGDDDDSSSDEASTTSTAPSLSDMQPDVTTPTTPATPTTPETPTTTTPAPTKPAPAPDAGISAAPGKPSSPQKCDEPIFGGDKPYTVETSSNGSSAPADCSEARSVILKALNLQTDEVGGWKCKTDLDAKVIATCTSLGRTIRARAAS